jgi:hypothetical protein
MTNLEQIMKCYSDNEPIDPNWDNKSMSYDTTRYNWAELFLQGAREIKPGLTQLEDLHLFFATEELLELRKKFEKICNSSEFARLVDAYIEEYFDPLLPHTNYMVQRTPGIRLMVPDQEKKGRLLTFHTGYWTGYGKSMTYTVWTPITKAFDSNTMQVMSWEDTKEVIHDIHTHQYDMDRVQTECEKRSWPVNLDYGQAWLFNQGHLHGNINNTTGVSRVSFDTRMALKGEEFGYRRAGSFYRFKGESTENNLSKLNRDARWVTFIDQNCEYIFPTPNYMIRDFLIGYGRNLGLTVIDFHNEYRYCTWNPQFCNIVKQGHVDGIILPSVYAFNLSFEQRLEVFEEAINKGIQLLFADENLVLSDKQDLDRIRKLFDFIR